MVGDVLRVHNVRSDSQNAEVKCPECYDNEIKFWRDQPMNEEIRKVLTWNRHAIVYYYTLDEALAAIGESIEDEIK
ncbi:hypothetical protein D3C75_947770 [compost metagenome]